MSLRRRAAKVRFRGFAGSGWGFAKLGGLPADITPHTCAPSEFASLASDLGYSESRRLPLLVGHKGRTVTSRYVHAADAVLLAAAGIGRAYA